MTLGRLIASSKFQEAIQLAIMKIKTPSTKKKCKMAKAPPPAQKNQPAIYHYNPFYVLQRKNNSCGISLPGSHKIHDPLFKFHTNVQQPHDFEHVIHLLGFI